MRFKTTILCILIFMETVFAVPYGSDILKYYKVSNFQVSFSNLTKNEEKLLDRQEKKIYKKLVKNEKYIKKAEFEKSEKLFPNFVPNLIRYINYYSLNGNYVQALEYAFKLKETGDNKLIPLYMTDYKIGILYARMGDYQSSNKVLIPYTSKATPVKDSTAYQVCENYYFMNDYKNAMIYAKKVPAQSEFFVQAQDILYGCYIAQKDMANAYKTASLLIKRMPKNPDNYMKLAGATSNNQEKLNNYYKAKELYYGMNNTVMINKINGLAYPLEQKKIDNAYKQITNYCKKPDWTAIRARNKGLLDNDIIYWDKRQTDFFENANECISKYKGNNLTACFSDLNQTQLKLDNTLALEASRRKEAEQREKQIKLLEQQNALLQEQNRLETIRNYQLYYNTPRYYYYRRYPYYYW